MQLIHELSWLWKGIGIIALASASALHCSVQAAQRRIHNLRFLACIILIVTILIGIIAMILCARVPMPI